MGGDSRYRWHVGKTDFTVRKTEVAMGRRRSPA